MMRLRRPARLECLTPRSIMSVSRLMRSASSLVSLHSHSLGAARGQHSQRQKEQQRANSYQHQNKHQQQKQHEALFQR